jgi:predicted Zn-dependent peptidase
MYRCSRLPNGLTIATAEMPPMTSVCVGLWAGVGGRFEPAELSGVSHFIEHMLFKGTRRRTARQIAEAVEGAGGTLDAFTDVDHTCFHAKAGHGQFESVLDVLVDLFLNSRFAPKDVKKERDVIMEEVAMYLDQPHLHVQELLNETLWPNHPLGRCITGRAQTLRAMSAARMLDFKRRNYVASNCLVTVAGRVRHRQVVEAVSRRAARFPMGRADAYLPVRQTQTRPRFRLLVRDIEQSHLEVGFRACSRRSGQRYALRLLNALLGENTMSRLFQTLREDHGLVYSVLSALSLYDDVGAMTISAGLDHDKLPKVLRLILREAERFTETPPASGELRRARDYVIGQIDLGFESTETQMTWLGEHLLEYGRLPDPESTRQRLAAVTPADVRAVAGEIFRPERLSVALIGPANQAVEVKAIARKASG